MRRSLVPLLFLVLPGIGAACEVTTVAEPDWHPPGAMAPGGGSWFGDDRLAALIPSDGQWRGMGWEQGYRDKFWWWRLGYDARSEPRPDLVITARRLDGPASPFTVYNATSGSGQTADGEWHSMLVDMEFPSSGCWEITGTYNEATSLTLVLRVRAR